MDTISKPGRGIFGLILMVGLILSACGGTASPAPTAPVAAQTASPVASQLTVANTASPVPAASLKGPLVALEWSGYELPEFWKPFADKYPNVKVDFTFFAEDSEAFAKVQSGFQTDIIHPCSSYIKNYVDSGLVQPIDTTRLSNWSGIPDSIAKLGQVDGKQYLVPWDWGYESILVRTDKVKKIPTSWADLWDPQYAGHVSIYDSGESANTIAGLVLGFDPWNATPAQQAQIKQKLIELRPNVLNYWSDYAELDQMVASGDVWLASSAWPSNYTAARKAGVPVEYITPTEGRLGYVCGYVITHDSKNVDLAYEYINAAIAPQSMANLSNEYGYGPSNMKAIPLIDPATVSLFQLNQPDVLSHINFLRPLTSAQRDLFVRQWDEVKAAP